MTVATLVVATTLVVVTTTSLCETKCSAEGWRFYRIQGFSRRWERSQMVAPMAGLTKEAIGRWPTVARASGNDSPSLVCAKHEKLKVVTSLRLGARKTNGASVHGRAREENGFKSVR